MAAAQLWKARKGLTEHKAGSYDHSSVVSKGRRPSKIRCGVCLVGEASGRMGWPGEHGSAGLRLRSKGILRTLSQWEVERRWVMRTMSPHAGGEQRGRRPRTLSWGLCSRKMRGQMGIERRRRTTLALCHLPPRRKHLMGLFSSRFCH